MNRVKKSSLVAQSHRESTFKLPVVLVAIYSAVYYFNGIFPLVGAQYVATVFAGVLGITWLVSSKSLRIPKLLVAIICIVIFMLLANEYVRAGVIKSPAGDNLITERYNLKLAWILTALFFYFALALGPFKKVTRAYYFAGLASVVASVIHALLDPSLGVRVYGYSGYGANTAMVGYLVLLALSLYQISDAENKLRRVFYLIGSGFIVVAIVISGSRGAILASLVVVAVYVMFGFQVKKFVASVILLCSTGAFLFMNAGLQHILDRLLLRILVSDQNIRLDIWKDAIDMFGSAPVWSWVFGTGAGSILFVANNSAHNSYLTHAIEYGLPGVIFIIICFILFVKVVRSSEIAIASSFSAGLSGLFVFSLVNDVMLTQAFAVMFVMSLMIVLQSKIFFKDKQGENLYFMPENFVAVNPQK